MFYLLLMACYNESSGVIYLSDEGCNDQEKRAHTGESLVIQDACVLNHPEDRLIEIDIEIFVWFGIPPVDEWEDHELYGWESVGSDLILAESVVTADGSVVVGVIPKGHDGPINGCTLEVFLKEP